MYSDRLRDARGDLLFGEESAEQETEDSYEVFDQYEEEHEPDPVPEEPEGDGEEPGGEEPGGEEPGGEEPGGEEPGGEEPDGEEPDGEEPDGEEPDGEEPDGEEPGGEEPDGGGAEGGDGDDVIEGREEDDELEGCGGDDEIAGGDGDDVLDGGAGSDSLEGGGGDDIYVVDDEQDEVGELPEGGIDCVLTTLGCYTLCAHVEGLAYAGRGDFTGTGNALDNALAGNDGHDRLDGAGGDDSLAGDDGNDRLNGGAGDDDLAGESGNDSVSGGGGEDLCSGGAGRDTLNGGDGRDALAGGAGNDRLNGGSGGDAMNGGAGDDVYFVNCAEDEVAETMVRGGTDRVESSVSYKLDANVEHLTLAGSSALNGTGNKLGNSIAGNGGANRLLGGEGNDRLSGAGGDDICAGGAGADTVSGGAGADLVYGGAGRDVLSGGAGRDGFYFQAAGSANADRILDFSAADDSVCLRGPAFAGIGRNGTLTADAFVAGSAARDAEDRIVYNKATGQLFFDADGTGPGAALLFATVAPGTALSHVDFNFVG